MAIDARQRPAVAKPGVAQVYRWELADIAGANERLPPDRAALAGVRETLREPPRAALQRCCPQLKERELDVLEGLLYGLSPACIATDMGLCIGTVKTYRARAFEILGIQFRSQLYAMLLNTCN